MEKKTDFEAICRTLRNLASNSGADVVFVALFQAEGDAIRLTYLKEVKGGAQ